MHDHLALLRAHKAGQEGSGEVLNRPSLLAASLPAASLPAASLPAASLPAAGLPAADLLAANGWAAARVLLVACGLLCCGTLVGGCGERGATDPAYVAEIDTWHAERVERLSAPTGWLTLVGLHRLGSGDNTLGSAADDDIRLVASAPARLGVIGIAAAGTTLTLAPDITVSAAGKSYTGPRPTIPLASDAGGEPTMVEVGSLQMYVIKRGDKLYLRVKDRDSAVRRSFTGIDRYPVDTRWRVSARLDTTTAGDIAVTNVLGQTEASACPGTLHFEIAGHSYQLRPMGEPSKSLFIVFGDPTNGHLTYGGGRFLSADPPGPDGLVVLDFNRATNPPCVFSPYATCPLPPPENVLPVAVTAGEKMWGIMMSGEAH